MSEASIEVGSLVLLVVVVLASWLLSLLLSLSCWHSYRSTWLPTRHSYCPQCALLLEPGERAEERLGFRSLNGSRLLASQLGRGDGLLEAGLSSCRIEEVGWVQPGRELDINTTVSRSFRRSPGGAAVEDNQGEDMRSRIVNKSKLSQVRVLTSPSPRQKDLTPVVSRTPGNAARSWRRSVRSKAGLNTASSLCKSVVQSEVVTSDTGCLGELEADLEVQQAPPDSGQQAPPERGQAQAESGLVKPVPDQETVLRTVERKDVLPRGRINCLSQGGRDTISQERRDAIRQERVRNWSDPKKERRKGSPGHTASAQFILDQYKTVAREGNKPLMVDIVLGNVRSAPATERPRTKIPQLTRKVSASAPPASGEVGQVHSSRKSHKAEKSSVKRDNPVTRTYRPGYSESDVTSQSEDEARRGAWGGRGVLEMTPKLVVVTPQPPPPTPLLDLDPGRPISLVPTPETARDSPGLPQVSLDLSSIHLARSPVDISQPGLTDFSPANPQAHSSANYSHQGRVLGSVSPSLSSQGVGVTTTKQVDNSTRVLFPPFIAPQEEPTTLGTVSESSERPPSSQTGSWEWDDYQSDLECQKLPRM